MMSKQVMVKFNRGEVDPDALTRFDVDKVNNSSSLMENALPIRLGPMSYRPGFGHLGTIPGPTYLAEFIAATDDAAEVEFTNLQARFWVDDQTVTRETRNVSIVNGTFDTDLSGWTNASSGLANAFWGTGGYAVLQGDGTNEAAIFQTITINDTGQAHGLRLTIVDAPVTLKLGTTVGGSEIFQGRLLPGVHSLLVSPTTNMTIRLSSSAEYVARVDAVVFETAGVMTLPTPVATADLQYIRHTQSADVMFVACRNTKHFRVERRGRRSWSVVDFRFEDGPFNPINSTPITLTPGDLDGDTTLTASAPFFVPGHVGALFKLASSGQTVSASVSSAGAGTGSIRVTGAGVIPRRFNISITGSWSATVTLQRSPDNSAWEDVENYTTNQSKNFNDGLDNSILFYRLHIKTGNYTSGTANLTLVYASGSIDGIGRVTSYTSSTIVQVQVLKDFGDTNPTRDWYEGEWSGAAGYPTAVSLYESRLWFAGETNLWGSVSDAFDSFDGSIEGDSRAIRKTIGFGPVDDVNWLLPTTRLIMGLASDEVSVRSNSFGEVLTPTNINLKSGTTQGSANIAPVKADTRAYFVQRSLLKIFEMAYSVESDAQEGLDTTTLNPSICVPGVKRIAVTRQPETRLWVVLTDGTMRVYLIDYSEDVRGWSRIRHAEGLIEDIVVVPGVQEDRVKVVVNRGGSRYYEKLALRSEALGGNISKTFDSFVHYVSPGTTITGLGHLEGKTVGVWADGRDRGNFAVAGGEVSLGTAWTNVTVGLRYTADYRSNKLVEYVEDIVLTDRKRVTHVGLVLANVWPGSVSCGPDAATLEPMPLVEYGQLLPTTATLATYEEQAVEFNGAYDTDSRVHVRMTGPATVRGLVFRIHDPVNQAG